MEDQLEKKVAVKLEHHSIHPLVKILLGSAVTFGSFYGFSEASRLFLDGDEKKTPGKYAGRR